MACVFVNVIGIHSIPSSNANFLNLTVVVLRSAANACLSEQKILCVANRDFIRQREFFFDLHPPTFFAVLIQCNGGCSNSSGTVAHFAYLHRR